MGKLSQIVNSKKVLVILVVAELVVCLILAFAVWSKREISISKEYGLRFVTKEQSEEFQALQNAFSLITSQYETLQKTTVPAQDYDNLVKAVQSLRTAAAGMGLISPNERLDKAELICTAVKQALYKQQQALSAMSATPATSAAEVDFLAAAVEKEIAQLGVIDSAQSEKYAIVLYHMQKVLDALGYKLSASIKTTNEAVLKFQADNQLKADGKIGAKTWAKVRELWNAKNPPKQPLTQIMPQTQTSTQTKPARL